MHGHSSPRIVFFTHDIFGLTHVRHRRDLLRSVAVREPVRRMLECFGEPRAASPQSLKRLVADVDRES